MSRCLGGFEGFDLTNPRGQLGGERFHLSCSKLALEDAILHPHYYTVATSTITHPREQQVVPLRVFSKGAHHSLREVRSKRLEGLLGILALGFSLQGLGHQF
jgi:hypothetical protein